MRLKIFFAVSVIVLLSIGSLQLADMYAETEAEVEKLEAAKVEMEREHISASEIQKMNELTEQLPDDGLEFTYHQWNEAEEKAAKMYEDSDGEFKKDWGMFLSIKAEKNEINPFIVYELLKVETGDQFDPDMVGPETSDGHAYGLAQFMKNTGPWIADKAGLDYEHEKLFDPYYAMHLSVTYLDYLYDEYDGNWDKALTAYHRGMDGMEQYKDEHGDAKSWYAVDIQEDARETAGDLVTFE
ncbi:lytic transglycosylase domain-containing protein [Salisediminibacterium halotolerans]|uniref:Transglycosylase SLT domain-containing protein n=1 Tax=Salisediminibacterium halotolerans TaxID=517425 RepID=A0A1H9S8H1_9BACI|nr:transglycosylase SLT domain-containing protein [Salisediminibacterium haloalkalitolerans]SER81261.1 Transglycosylase SLT domain-containing protein [Salisediminibacterium haloalkalitolerans]